MLNFVYISVNFTFGQVELVISKVLESLDDNDDGVITLREFTNGGENGLPSFPQLHGLGHHYGQFI